MNFLRALLSRKIVGLGILSINKLQFSVGVFEAAVQLLVNLKTVISRDLSTSDIFTVVGIYISGDETRDPMRNIFSSVGAPDVVIGLGHIAYPNNNMTNCEIIPHSTYSNDTRANQLRANYGSLYSLACEGFDIFDINLGLPFQQLATNDGAQIQNFKKSRFFVFEDRTSLAVKVSKRPHTDHKDVVCKIFKRSLYCLTRVPSV
ncbi:uncharacterized protein LOC125945713 [Dermacentor silvarum]|uniref:uncharacterized protein LOC125945713 n=1 Tax=Dermacentor silvarum TaxID=543639 RepID=UPI002100F2A6|nr:uncharacterized protein LOC125945713 [Dermacentor silvarum]